MTKTADGKKGDTNNSQIPTLGLPEKHQTFCPEAVGYEIRVKDHLETYWFEWFEGWSVTNLENGEVMLKSDQVDQSKLHGTLNKIRDLNLALLSVICVPADDQAVLPSTGEE
jgi:hypothetical protein